GPDDAFLVEREVVGVTAACALLRRAVFDEVGGLSLDLPVNFNDVDLGQKVLTAGQRVVWTPHARLHHFESRSRVARVASAEINTLNDRWGARLVTDPFWGYPDVAAVPAEGSA
ncbi:MAG: glycosyltransferase family 2 protein, partial [Nakamurella sp.]